MRKVLHKVKSQWVVLGVLGATVVSLGTADVRQVSASEIERASTSETISARELGTADVVVEAAEQAAHTGLDHAISTATTDGTATVFVHWNEDGTITVTVKDLNGSVLHSDLLGDSAGENSIRVLAADQNYYTITVAVKNDYAKIVATTEVDYPAVIARTTDAINTAPWGVRGYQTRASSADYAGKTVDVTKEQTTDYGVTWAFVSLNGKELGWIAKDALKLQTYAAITSETVVDYPARISRGTDAINQAPWGTKGFRTIATSAAHVGKTVEVIKEQTTDYGVTWAQISLNGEVLGWIAKDALTAQTYAAIVSETVVDYAATVNRDSDAINTAPWGVKGYRTLSSSAAYKGQAVEVTKEQKTDYGVTWAQVSQNGQVLGWIAKDALKVQTYAQITKETAVSYDAIVNRDSDAINTAPWAVKGYRTLSSSAAYKGQTVEVIKEQTTDYGVTWAQISKNGQVLGWIAKDALKVQAYAQITKETPVSYSATVNRDSDAINTAPWGTKGFQTISSSANYYGKSVTVSQEKTMDYGVTWALISIDGKEIGWIAKSALTQGSYSPVTSTRTVDYPAMITRGTDAINTHPWGVQGGRTVSSSANYYGQSVTVSQEKTMDYGVTWALISIDGKEIGWIAKSALTVGRARHTVENGALQATIDMALLNQEFLVHLNALRSSAGLDAVVYAPEFQDEADKRSLEEAEQTIASFDNGTRWRWDIDHDRPDGSAFYSVFENQDFGSGENLLGSNIDYRYALTDINEKNLAYSMFKLWEASAGHRDNMLGRYYTTSTVSAQLINVESSVYYVGIELLTTDQSY